MTTESHNAEGGSSAVSGDAKKPEEAAQLANPAVSQAVSQEDASEQAQAAETAQAPSADEVVSASDQASAAETEQSEPERQPSKVEKTEREQVGGRLVASGALAASQPPQSVARSRSPRALTGVVTSNKADKTISVRVERRIKHPVYGKYVRRSTRLHAHDEKNECGEGDVVTVVETRPISKTKSWRLDHVVERAG